MNYATNYLAKKISLLLSVTLLVNISIVKGQFTYEYTYTIPQGGAAVFLTNLGNENYKYVMLDYFGNQFSLFNLDHSPFIVNIPLPLPSDSFALYQVGYITTTLFDCDSANVEYALMTQSPSNSEKFMVYRTDGTQVFSRDSVTVQYCFGCNVGSVEFSGIVNTPSGTKLFLQNQNREIFIYGLCGILPIEIKEVNQSGSYVQVFPNPTINQINFEVTPPNNYEVFELTIFDGAFRTIKTITVTRTSLKINLLDESLFSGSYFYSLHNKNKVFQTGQFFLTK